jgi:hypothetical protein
LAETEGRNIPTSTKIHTIGCDQFAPTSKNGAINQRNSAEDAVEIVAPLRERTRSSPMNWS